MAYCQRASVLDCASPPALFHREPMVVNARKTVPATPQGQAGPDALIQGIPTRPCHRWPGSAHATSSPGTRLVPMSKNHPDSENRNPAYESSVADPVTLVNI
jgi:hypothetical protein